MDALNVRDYRNNLAASFTRADQGENVIIRRKNHLYALISLGEEKTVITPEIQAKIDAARLEKEDGKSLHFDNAHGAIKWMDEL